MIIRARLASTPYLLRYSFDYDGINPESMTVTNAQLLADMAGRQTPLAKFFDIGGLDATQTHLRFNGPELRIGARGESVGLPAYNVDISPDVDGRPQLIVDFPIKDFEILGIVDLEFRHTFYR